MIEISHLARRAAFALLAGSMAVAPTALQAGGATDSSAAQTATQNPGPKTPADEANLPPLFAAPDSALGAALRLGGYILVFRHGVTDWAQNDVAGENFEDRAAQRNLSDEGRRLSEEIGKAIVAAGIPIGDVIASPMWRCRDTAQLMFGRHTTSVDLFRRGVPSREARIKLLGTKPKKGTNSVLVTHQDVLIPIVAGLRREQLREGEAFIVKPLGDGKFEILAQARLDHWRTLAPRKS